VNRSPPHLMYCTRSCLGHLMILLSSPNVLHQELPGAFDDPCFVSLSQDATLFFESSECVKPIKDLMNTWSILQVFIQNT
jgi:hypothetical protein